MAVSNSSLDLGRARSSQQGQSRRPHHQLRPSRFWQIAEDLPARLRLILMGLSILLPLGLWSLISSQGWVNPTFLPSPLGVLNALGRLWQDNKLVSDTASSFFRVGLGFLLATVVAAPIGILMGTFASIRALLEPISGFLRYLPAAAFVPLLIIYLGLGEEPKIALIFIGTVFFNVLMIMDAVKFVPKELIETTYTLGGKRPQVLLRVITPYVMPSLIDALRVNAATAWNLVVVAELIAAETGLGKRIEIAQRFFRTDEIFACLLVLGLIGFAIDMAFRLLLRQTCQWSFK